MSSNWGLLVLDLIGGGALTVALIYVVTVRRRRTRTGAANTPSASRV